MFLDVLKNRQRTERANRQIRHLQDKRILVDLIGFLLPEILFDAIDFRHLVFIVLHVFKYFPVEFPVHDLKLVLF